MELINCAFTGYNLPSAIYVDNTIAAGMSYGYISAMESPDKDYQKTYLFVIAQESCITMSIVRFTKGQMELLYTRSKECYGCRALYMELVEKVLEKSNSEYKDEILRNDVLRAKSILAMEKQINYLCTLEEDDSISIKMDYLNDESDETNYAESGSLTGKDVNSCLDNLYSEVVQDLIREFKEVSEYTFI